MNYQQLYSGEHLKEINPNWTYQNWSYRRTFEAKMKYVMKLLGKVPSSAKILDVGCGQGLLVKEFRQRGYNIIGIDAFYENEFVRKEDIFKNSFKENSFDLILCLDVIEHFSFEQQERLVKELHRLLKVNGQVIFSIPNLAHLSSRMMFLFLGKLMRTAKVSYHPGDRPIAEYLEMIKKYFLIKRKKGLSATIPVLFQITQLFPAYTYWLYFLLKPFAVFYSWCFNVIVVGEKR